MAIEIPIDRPNLGPYFADLDRLNAKFKEVQASADNLSEAAGAKPSKGGGAKGMGGGRAINWDDPWGKLDSLRLQRYLGKREGLGDDALRGLDLAIARQTKRVARSEKELSGGKTQGEKLLDALMTSRVTMGMGGRMQFAPLFGKLASAGLVDPSKYMGALDKFANTPGVLSAVTKLAIPAAVAAAGAVGVYRLAEASAASMRSGSAAFWTSGGTPRETGQLSAIGGFLGMTAEQAAQRAVELGDRLRGGGYGASYLRSRGIVDQGIWTTDKATNFLKAIEALRTIKSDSQAIRVARDLGMSDVLRVRDISPGTYGRLKDSMGDYGSPSQRKAEANYNAQKETFSNYWDSMVRSIGEPLLGSINGVVSGDIFKGPTNPGWYDALRNVLNLGLSVTPFPKLPQNGRTGSDTKENTQAIKDMTRTMKDHAEWLGGGARARGALPAAWTYMQMEEGLRSDARSLGAFSV